MHFPFWPVVIDGPGNSPSRLPHKVLSCVMLPKATDTPQALACLHHRLLQSNLWCNRCDQEFGTQQQISLRFIKIPGGGGESPVPGCRWPPHLPTPL